MLAIAQNCRDLNTNHGVNSGPHRLLELKSYQALWFAMT